MKHKLFDFKGDGDNIMQEQEFVGVQKDTQYDVEFKSSRTSTYKKTELEHMIEYLRERFLGSRYSSLNAASKMEVIDQTAVELVKKLKKARGE